MSAWLIVWGAGIVIVLGSGVPFYLSTRCRPLDPRGWTMITVGWVTLSIGAGIAFTASYMITVVGS